MGMFHNPYDLFLCPFKISLESLIILISLLSEMAMQSLSHSWPKEIREALFIPSNWCDFLHVGSDLLINGCFLSLLHS